jgi:REP element-mobilizing transposase RayT
MPRPLRREDPSICYHVFNRALGRRLAFERDADRRAFLSLLAKAVHHGDLLTLAFAVMGNHFHLLVRSPAGRLSEALHLVQGKYARQFNLARDRDGPLWRGRFEALPVRSLRYKIRLLTYIDGNPVHAGLAIRAQDYPFCSAHWYARRVGPPWLDRTWVEDLVCARAGISEYEPAAYARVIGCGLTAAQRRLVESRMEADPFAEDPLDALLEAGERRIAHWLLERARLADAVPPTTPLVDGETVLRVVATARASAGEWVARRGRRIRNLWDVLSVALLRELAGGGLTRIALRAQLSVSHVHRTLALHRELMRADSIYAERAGRLAQDALRSCHGEWGESVPGTDLPDS